MFANLGPISYVYLQRNFCTPTSQFILPLTPDPNVPTVYGPFEPQLMVEGILWGPSIIVTVTRRKGIFEP